MKLVIKHIKIRFYIQIVTFLLLGFLGILISLYFGWRVIKINRAEKFPSMIKQKITTLNSLQQTFILEIKGNDNFIINRESEIKDQFSNTLTEINNDINSLNSNQVVKSSPLILHLSDSLRLACETYKNIFEDLSLELQKRGIESSGLINKILESSQTILDGSSVIQNTSVYEILLKMKQKEYEYLYSLNADKLNEISNLIAEYNMELTSLDPELFFVTDFSMELDVYSQNIEHLKNIDNRIGLYSKETGILKDLNDQLFLINNIIDKIEHDIVLLETKQTRVNTILFVILGAIIFLLISILTFLFGKNIFHPISRLVDITTELSKGRLSVKTLNESSKFEFHVINKNLNNLVNILNSKKTFVDALHNDNLDIEFELPDEKDEFGKLLQELKKKMIDNRNEQARYNEENDIRRYMNEGLTKFADILRTGSGDLNKLSDAFISNLVKYMESIQGGLFLIDEENPEALNLTGAFAYNRKKYISKTIKIGEGLVGTCAAEEKRIHLTEIPEDYMFITSGLGDAPPTNLLIIPVIYETKLVGVIELASLKEYTDNQKELVERIAESLASTILNERTNSQTSDLLKKSQQQAAEMAEQEEEMRQNMEELKATQEESARREEELEGLMNAINTAFYVTEYDLEGNISNMNENLLLKLDKKIEQVINKFHTEAFGSVDPDLINLDLFSLISIGETKQVIEDIKVNNKTRKLQHNFSPVKSKNGEVIKIINISSDITKQYLVSK